MKRIFVLQLTLLLLSVYAFATPISESDAREKAARFMLSKKQGGTSSARSAQRFGGSAYEASLTSVESQEAYYVFNIDSVNGYVIVSGDDRMPDVLGYAYHGTYNPKEIPDNMRAWLQGYVEEYQYLQSHSDVKGASLTSVIGDEVLPMLDCKWGQGFPYNNLCPKINGQTTVTGCVATAMAQVMYYHKWPKQTTKAIPAYTTTSAGIRMPQIEVTTIDWDNMVPSYGYSGGTSVQNQAVAKLMLLCGSAVKMNYGLGGSSAYCDPSVLTEYFGYNKLSVSEVRRSNYSSDIWNQMIYDEVKDGRPVLYSGQGREGGHQFVIDGYDMDDYFHVNWGWGGYEDNYFLLSSLNGYNSDQDAIIGLEGQGSVDRKYAYAELVGETLTFYYDNKRETRTGTMFNINNNEWTNDEYKSTITAVIFDSSFGDYNFLVSTRNMFYDMENLTSIQGLEYLNTQNVTDMGWMFDACKNLTSLDLSNFDTQNVTDMSGMFSGCENLTFLDLSNFDTQNVTNMSYMFCGCQNLTSLDVSRFNTQNATGMSYMFSVCNNLTSLDLSNFDTQNVTNMNGLFYNCQNITSLDLSNFDTQNVTDMDYMFSGCQNLTSLDVCHFNTQNVTNMSGMFASCKNLTSLDVSNFNTQNVTTMYDMFYGCGNITSLDLRIFDTQNVTNMSYMFCACYLLQDIYIGENWSTQNVTDGNYMFSGCSNLIGEKGTQYDYKKSDYTYAHLDGGIDNPGYFSTMGYSYCYALLSDDNKTLTFYYGNGKEVTGSIRVMSYDYYSYRDWDSVAQSFETVIFDKSMADCDNISGTAYWFYNCENLTTIQGLEYLNTQNATNMRYMFYGCKNLTSLDVSNFNTQNVTSMNGMFSGCENLTSLDVSHFNTQNVTNMSSMFYGCENLTSLDLRSFNTHNVTSMSYMFCACYLLQDIYIGENWSTQNVTDGNYMFSGCSNLIGEKGTQYSYGQPDDYTYAHLDGGIDNPGYFSTMGYSYCYALLSDDNKTLTFYYGNGKEVTGSMKVKSYAYSSYRDWDSVAQSLETVIFDKSMADCDNISGTAYWFYNCENLTTIQGLEYLNTQNATNMRYMFSGCKNLTFLDVSHFNTQNVANMSGMFSNCENLTSLDVSHFNTQNATNMSGMFDGCENLTSLDVSHFNTQNVTSMGSMFTYCYNLTSLDLSNFDTHNVTNMSYMFYYSRNINKIYVSEGWNTEKLEYGDYLFTGCRNLVGQDGTKYDYNYTDKTKAHYGAGGYLTYKSRSLRGDVNGDGKVDINDATFITNIILGIEEATETVDVNNDGIVNMPDAMFIINYIKNGKFPDE